MLPADEDYARSVLSIFQFKKIRARQSLSIDEAEVAFQNLNFGRPTDFKAALAYGTDRGWFWVGFGRVRITGDGHDEMQTVERRPEPKVGSFFEAFRRLAPARRNLDRSRSRS